MNDANKQARFPEGLLDWSGHRGGGVRKLFYEASGRPSSEIIRTNLLNRLESWAGEIGAGNDGVPRIVLLVGGPGNGKTEAVEFAIGCLDISTAAGGGLKAELASRFDPTDGTPPPRLAEIQLPEIPNRGRPALQIVQDASAGDSHEHPNSSPAQLLVQDLQDALSRSDVIYLACVNRGVLDDALISATDSGNTSVRPLIEQVVGSVGTGPKPIACWPLHNFEDVAVWPMDIESLLKSGPSGEIITTPAAQLLDYATKDDEWPVMGECEAGPLCPFCLSREALSSDLGEASFLRILRWYELASGKRWSFRDLGSLFAYLLAGAPPDGVRGAKYSPCAWAAKQLALKDSTNPRDAKARSLAPYLLVSRLYKHSLFGFWPRVSTRELRNLLKDLDLQTDDTLSGLLHFLADSRRSTIPPTLNSQLEEVCDILDPALADPDSEVKLSGNTTVAFREIDIRFSQSVGEGLKYIRKFLCLTALEIELLKNLDAADARLSFAGITKNRPEVANKVQSMLRDFACRIVRRSVGCRAAAVRDGEILIDFEHVVSGHEHLLYEASQQVESLLNSGDKFSVVLNTTFGEPIPSPERRVTLTTDKQRVRVPKDIVLERPVTALKFLTVGPESRREFIPLTYELYKSVRELRMQMLAASLPRAVVALLDITRARLGGHIVRDEELLEAGTIQIGIRKDVIVRQRGQFLIKREAGA
ncbi:MULTISPECIES: hypothetical protein [Acidobacteriaceae]|uniref:hypothetical protein n=1 Tax=Acidobacteriaceae TaxID=204434 RepID=UPI00131E8119|nr:MULTISPECIES: hypothetical protein [Acidobacteriaceae]MDW5266672.1 hypothetical protein [Edaphobacter sp.]